MLTLTTPQAIVSVLAGIQVLSATDSGNVSTFRCKTGPERTFQTSNFYFGTDRNLHSFFCVRTPVAYKKPSFHHGITKPTKRFMNKSHSTACHFSFAVCFPMKSWDVQESLQRIPGAERILVALGWAALLIFDHFPPGVLKRNREACHK